MKNKELTPDDKKVVEMLIRNQPNQESNLESNQESTLETRPNERGRVNPEFLRFLESQGVQINAKLSDSELIKYYAKYEAQLNKFRQTNKTNGK